jgi:hypothetical protein
MTAASLKDKPVRDLARLAKRQGVQGWHAMRKDELIRALVRKARAAKQGVGGRTLASAPPPETAARDAMRNAVVSQRIAEARERLARAKSLVTGPEGGRLPRPVRDRMVLMVRGPHWLHAFWEITPRSVERAKAALGPEWHTARPILRVLQVETGIQASPSERVAREIEIHGGVKNWFIDIREPLRCRVEIGYRTQSGRFHGLVRSNTVSTPVVSHGDTLDAHWGDIVEQCEKVYAMSGGFSPENNATELRELFEERLQRPMSSAAARSESNAEDAGTALPGAELQVDAEMLVYGVTQPGMGVMLQGEPVKVHADGTFRVRVDLPNRRQVLPIVTTTPEGVERQTVVIAVERNTKTMEPIGGDIEE